MTHKKGGRKFRFHVMKSWMFSQEGWKLLQKFIIEKKHIEILIINSFNRKTKKPGSGSTSGIRTTLKSLAHDSVINMKKSN
jgi:hypothetical protein